MSQKFALYDSIVTLVDSTSFENMGEKWKLFTTSVTQLNETECTDIYLLILHYYLLHEDTTEKEKKTLSKSKGKANRLPYNGKTFDMGKGVIYQIDQLPIDLQKMILTYFDNIIMHKV
jgi:hypothetical protein